MSERELILAELERRIAKYRKDGFGCHANSLERFRDEFVVNMKLKCKDCALFLNGKCERPGGECDRKEQPVCEGLEEEIKRYYEDMDGDCRYAQTARHFAKWMREQMMKEAVEGWVARDLDGSLWFHYHKPHLENEIEKTWWGSSDNSFSIYEPNHPGFENVTFEGGPIRVKLAIIKEGYD